MNLFTVDIDWAPEAVIADTLAMFEQYGVACTLFATHRSPLIDRCSRELFEVAIHPNFNPLLAGKGGDAGRIVDELLELYPEARGVRCHSMAQSALLFDLFQSRGLTYDANQFLPYWTDIKPFRIWNGLLRIPYNWEDDIHFSYGRSFDDTGLQTSTLNVFDFHPIHVFLNTDTADCYNRARQHYHDADALMHCRNDRGPGARTLLERLLQQASAQGHGTTLAALADRQPQLV